MKKYDIAIIGSGPGGYVSAIRASKSGKKVAIIEADFLGGTCLNRGCIPSKTLLRHAEVIENIKAAREWGIETGELTFSFAKMMERKNGVTQQLRNGIEFLMKKGKIDVLHGVGEVVSETIITVRSEQEEQTIEAEHIIIATGSTPVVPPIEGIDSIEYYTSDTIFDLQEIPDSIVIVGGGIIGVEFACIFASLGVDVKVIEMFDRIITTEDPEVSKHLAKELVAKGVKIYTSAQVTQFTNNSQKIMTTIKQANGELEKLSAEAVLLSVGRKPNTAAVEKLHLSMNKGFIDVNDYMQTNVPSIYAIGDVIGGYQLAHVSSAEGLIAAGHIAGEKQKIDYRTVPRCVYTNPEIASVGLSEQQLKEKGMQYKAETVNLSSNGKALASAESSGFVKLLADPKYGEILGATLVGPHVTEMIGEPAAFIHLEGTVDELATMIHAHPSVSESIYEAGASWLGKGIHN
ncbi:dihydrolipoyl dehydrogenase [Gracilibacillus alcaliphilus]|uniref:dihydrolipoyl dehydrogenase n=1 Tax=Gracilibacillus alcaliphilus TaxID=1401441 RepID=UPI003B82FAB6|nr:dihydrolipoamide dehydrogenase [Gracilibacillus alcaliphilus]